MSKINLNDAYQALQENIPKHFRADVEPQSESLEDEVLKDVHLAADFLLSTIPDNDDFHITIARQYVTFVVEFVVRYLEVTKQEK